MIFNLKCGKLSLSFGENIGVKSILHDEIGCNSGNLITLDESLNFQKSFQEIEKTLQLPIGRYKDGEFKLRVSENFKDPNPHNWKRYVIWNVFGDVIYDSAEDFSKVVDGRYPITNDVLNRLKNVKTWVWVRE